MSLAGWGSDFRLIAKILCEGCGREIVARNGETFVGSTDGQMWHYGCAPKKEEAVSPYKYARGDRVCKVGGDYTFEGEVVAAFDKRNGLTRYVVEDDRGLLFIFNEAGLQPVGGPVKIKFFR